MPVINIISSGPSGLPAAAPSSSTVLSEHHYQIRTDLGNRASLRSWSEVLSSPSVVRRGVAGSSEQRWSYSFLPAHNFTQGALAFVPVFQFQNLC
ncbi:hypothetical protein SRHO_G00091240 [Serrasalmus rhombeus]